jgi:phospholipid:diacylglycerol acyltransferase
MLKKRNGFSFANGETHNTKTDSVSDNNTSRLKKILRYNTTPTNKPSTDVEDTPEDILADSINLFKQSPLPVWKRKRFHFIIGLSVGLLAAAYGASTTPTAQTHLNGLQLFLQDMDLTKMIPALEVDEIFGNFANYFTTPAGQPSSDQTFMPALTLK